MRCSQKVTTITAPGVSRSACDNPCVAPSIKCDNSSSRDAHPTTFSPSSVSQNATDDQPLALASFPTNRVHRHEHARTSVVHRPELFVCYLCVPHFLHIYSMPGCVSVSFLFCSSRCKVQHVGFRPKYNKKTISPCCFTAKIPRTPKNLRAATPTRSNVKRHTFQ